MSAKKITLKQFEDSIKSVLLARPEKRAKYESLQTDQQGIKSEMETGKAEALTYAL